MEDTMAGVILETAARCGGKEALRFKRGGVYQSISYRELAEQVQRFAVGLQRLGVRPGDRVAILAPNGPAWAVADLGTMYAGGISVPVHTSFSAALVRYVVDHAGASILAVVGLGLLDKVAAVLPELSALKHLVVAEVEPPESVGRVAVHRWEEFNGAGLRPQTVDVEPDDPASIVYTSGTTGLPKGVVLTHGNFLSNVRAALQAVPVYPTDTFLSFLPLSHVLERMAGYYAPLTQGATIAYAESPATLKVNLMEVQPTVLISVPRIFEKFHDGIWAKVNASSAWRKKLFSWALKQRRGTWQHRVADGLVFKKIRQALGGRLRLTISGGASLHPPLAKFFDRLGVLILEGYGLTETAPVITVNTQTRRRIGSVGTPLPGVAVKIAPDKEILTRGENVCAGYWQDAAATRELIDADGWLHTGDLGFVDADGFLFIIGRRKEMLVTAGGKNIWPAVLENAINSDPLVAQSMAVAHGRPYVAALVVPVWPSLLSVAAARGWPQEIAALCAHPGARTFFRERIAKALVNLPEYEQVRRIALLPEEFSAERDEVTPTQKLRRSVIERHYAKEIAALYER